MKISRVLAAYFSGTGTTKKVVEEIAGAIASSLGINYDVCEFSLPSSRDNPLRFSGNDLVVFGIPVYAGRVPNLLLKFLNTIEGNHGLAVPIVLYGNRNYDDALIELRDLLEKGGLHPIAAGAFIGEHSFSRILAQDRPDESDMMIARTFALKVTEKVKTLSALHNIEPLWVIGSPQPYSGYYQPRHKDGQPIDIRKVKPLTKESCNDCMLCAKICPMGAISYENPREINGICIKCGACIKGCPLQAKYYTDEGYLCHKQDLEESFKARKEPLCFL